MENVIILSNDRYTYSLLSFRISRSIKILKMQIFKQQNSQN